MMLLSVDLLAVLSCKNLHFGNEEAAAPDLVSSFSCQDISSMHLSNSSAVFELIPLEKY